jgi:hypothetical protein
MVAKPQAKIGVVENVLLAAHPRQLIDHDELEFGPAQGVGPLAREQTDRRAVGEGKLAFVSRKHHGGPRQVFISPDAPPRFRASRWPAFGPIKRDGHWSFGGWGFEVSSKSLSFAGASGGSRRP